LTLVQDSYIKPTGFLYCKVLNNAAFDPLAPVIPWNGQSVAESNSDVSDFLNLIDNSANNIFKELEFNYPQASRNELHRLACYLAAEGNTGFSKISTSNMLISVDSASYFEPILPTISPNPAPNRRRFKIAYLLMVHLRTGLNSLKNLLAIIDDGEAIILIHVDKKDRDGVYSAILQLLNSATFKNVHLAKTRFANIWGHVSLVFSQLSGFWELFDMADWDFVINLSNFDYPLGDNLFIHNNLKNASLDSNWIDYFSEDNNIIDRIYKTRAVSRTNLDDLTLIQPQLIASPPFPRWKLWKQSQWMILSRKAVQFLRHDNDSLRYLAFSEFVVIPDENYFATVLLNSETMRNTVINDNKRYLRFRPNSAHPKWLTYNDRYFFPREESPSSLFIRKLNSTSQIFREIQLIDWIKKEHFLNNIWRPCTKDYLSSSKKCLLHFVQKIAIDNDIVLIPVRHVNWPSFLQMSLNLRVSWKITNIVVWSLDEFVHQKVVAEFSNILSIFLPGFPAIEPNAGSNSENVIKAKGGKYQAVNLLLKAGFNVWYLDINTHVKGDFRQLVQGPGDIFLGKYMEGPCLLSKLFLLQYSSDFVYFKSTAYTIDFVTRVTQRLPKTHTVLEAYAFNQIVEKDIQLGKIKEFDGKKCQMICQYVPMGFRELFENGPSGKMEHNGRNGNMRGYQEFSDTIFAHEQKINRNAVVFHYLQ
jgi:hypothetical protein